MKKLYSLLILISMLSCTQNDSNKTDYGLYISSEVKEYMKANNVDFTPLEKDIIKLTIEQYMLNTEWLRLGIKYNPDMKESTRENYLQAYAYQKLIIEGDELVTLHIIKKVIKKFKKARGHDEGMKKLFDYSVKEKNWAQKSLDELKQQYNIK